MQKADGKDVPVWAGLGDHNLCGDSRWLHGGTPKTETAEIPTAPRQVRASPSEKVATPAVNVGADVKAAENTVLVVTAVVERAGKLLRRPHSFL